LIPACASVCASFLRAAGLKRGTQCNGKGGDGARGSGSGSGDGRANGSGGRGSGSGGAGGSAGGDWLENLQAAHKVG
jgi:hypothetical protein